MSHPERRLTPSTSTARDGLLQQELKEWSELLAELDGKDNESDQLSLTFDD